MKEQVVILHGIKRSSSHMRKLAKFLEQNGYEVFNLDYKSTKFDIETLTIMVEEEIATSINHENKVHYIGYSMGGLLVRALLNKKKPKNLGKVIQLAPPNHGSEVADFFKNNFIYKKLFGPAGSQLVTNFSKIDEICGKVDYELGILAGCKSLDPISSIILPKGNDGKVSIASTKLDGMKDHVVLSASHLLFPSNKQVHKQVLNFLQNGKFK